MTPPLPEVLARIDEANVHRAMDEGLDRRSGSAESWLERAFGVSCVLAVYGTLAPGKSNHHVVAPLGGVWSAGVVFGRLTQTEWGAPLGYLAFAPDADGPALPVHVLRSERLQEDWPRLDAFEGDDYRRILVPVFEASLGQAGGVSCVANLYAARWA